MSATTYNLPYTRFIRQVRTEPMALLALDLAAQTALDLLREAAWEMCDEQFSDFPARNALQDGFNPAWDAFKLVGNYTKGTQRAYAGMVAYRYSLPPAAIEDQVDVVSLALPLHVDRWLVDGVRIAAWLSDNISPANDWQTLRNGAAMADALLPMEYTADDPPKRIVVEKEAEITLTLPPNSTARRYLYVVVSLEDYTTTSGTTGERPFWIEGAAALSGTLATVTLSDAVAPDPDLRLPLALDGDGLRLRMQGDASNIQHPWMRKFWALRMMLGGRLSKSAVAVETAISAPMLRPVVQLDGGSAIADAALQRIFAPKTIAAGRTAWLRSSGSYNGAAPLRLLLFSGEGRPNLDNPATWEGTGSAVVGSAIIPPPADGELIPIPVSKNIDPGSLWLLATLADIPSTDQPSISGYAPNAGISLIDAHISANPAAASFEPEWIEFNGLNAGALLLPLLFGSGPRPDANLYGLGQYCSVANARASGAAWLDGAPAGAQAVSSAATNWCLTVAGGLIYLAGSTLPAGTDTAQGEPAAWALSTKYGVAGIDNFSAPFVYGSLMGVSFQNYQSEDKPVASLLSGYEYLVAVIEDPPGTYYNKVYGLINRVASGFRSAIDNANVIDWTSASASTTHLIQRNYDGTCIVFENTTLSDPTAAIDVSSWSGIIQVAAAPNAVFGLKSDGTVVASGLTAGWCDLDQLDGLFVDSIVACSHAQRVAFHIDRS